MIKDPIVEEIHKFRESHAAQFNYDIRKIVEYYIKRQKQNKRKIVNFSQNAKKDEIQALSVENEKR